MTKRKKEKRHRTPSLLQADLIPSKYQHVASVGFILLALVLFFQEVIFGQKVQVSWENLATAILNA